MVESPRANRDTQVTLATTGSVGPPLRIAAVAIMAVVLVAFLKPWGTPAAAPPLASAVDNPAASGHVLAVAAPSPVAKPLDLVCLTPETWRVIGEDHEPAEESRRWLGVTPVAASGPLSVSVPHVRMPALNLVGLGYCAGGQVSVVGQPTVYVISADGTAATALTAPLLPMLTVGHASVELFLPPVLRLVTTNPTKAQVFQPPAGADTWAPGVYVIQVTLAPAAPDRTATSLWFGVDVTASTLPVH